MAKTRVHELAKTYGIESKEVLDKLKEMGEFVKSASSTIELPVEMKFKKTYGDTLLANKAAAEPAEQPAPAPAAKKAAAAEAPATVESDGAETIAERDHDRPEARPEGCRPRRAGGHGARADRRARGSGRAGAELLPHHGRRPVRVRRVRATTRSRPARAWAVAPPRCHARATRTTTTRPVRRPVAVPACRVPTPR